MGIIRKAFSISTLGAVDFRSDKERVARYARQTRNAVREQSRLQAQLAAEDLAAAQRREALATYSAPSSVAARPGPGWYSAPDGQPSVLQWWDGARWTEHRQPLPPPPG